MNKNTRLYSSSCRSLMINNHNSIQNSTSVVNNRNTTNAKYKILPLEVRTQIVTKQTFNHPKNVTKTHNHNILNSYLRFFATFIKN